MTIAIYPGSFDPITNGHLDIIERSSMIFEKVIIGVMVNPKKTYRFSLETREILIHGALKETLPEKTNIEVISFDGLLVDFMKKQKIDTIVKGLRTATDYEYEFRMALINKRLHHQAETVFIPTSEAYSLVSSSMVKELYDLGGDVSDYVPDFVQYALDNQ